MGVQMVLFTSRCQLCVSVWAHITNINLPCISRLILRVVRGSILAVEFLFSGPVFISATGPMETRCIYHCIDQHYGLASDLESAPSCLDHAVVGCQPCQRLHFACIRTAEPE